MFIFYRACNVVMRIQSYVSSRMFNLFIVFFFFKQKTAYEMRISDWSSDVCSSDLKHLLLQLQELMPFGVLQSNLGLYEAPLRHIFLHNLQIGRASCRERVCQYV